MTPRHSPPAAGRPSWPPAEPPRSGRLTINGCAWLGVAVVVAGLLTVVAVWVVKVRNMAHPA